MKKMKRLISGILALCLLIPMMPWEGVLAVGIEPWEDTVTETIVVETRESGTVETLETVGETTVPAMTESASESIGIEETMVGSTEIIEVEETVCTETEAIISNISSAMIEYSEEEINEMISSASYPDQERPYWIIFHEGYRDSRLEMSIFDILEADDEVYIVWDRGLELNDENRFLGCDQYYIENACWTLFVEDYGVLSDYSTGVIASNLDVYDGNGNLICKASDYPGSAYIEPGTKPEDTEIVCPNGKQLKSVTRQYLNGDADTYTFKYNEAGFLTEVSGMQTRGGYSDNVKQKMVYDRSGRLIEVWLPLIEWLTVPKDSYTYNDAGQLISMTQTEGSSSTTNYIYDASGILIESVTEFDTGTAVSRYTYGENGLATRVETKRSFYDGTSYSDSSTYEYDAQQRLRSVNGTSYGKEYKCLYDYGCMPFVGQTYSGENYSDNDTTLTIQDVKGHPIWSIYNVFEPQYTLDEEGYVAGVSDQGMNGNSSTICFEYVGEEATQPEAPELSGWQKAYYDFISTNSEAAYYEPVYLDLDGVPEMWIYYGGALGCTLLTYENGTLYEYDFASGDLIYAESNNLFCHSGGTSGTGEWDRVYTLKNGILTGIASGSYISGVYIWNGNNVSEAEYFAYRDQYLDPEITKIAGGDNSETYDYNGILAYLHTVKPDEPDKAENGLLISSDYTNLSVSIGNILTLSAGILMDGEKMTDVSGITFQITDTSMLKMEQTGISNNTRYLKLRGLKEGKTTVVISDSETGYKAKVPISVYKNKVHSYSLSSVPVQYIEKYPTNFYNLNGLYVDSFSYSVNDDQTANVSFDVYNTNYTYGIVEVCNEQGMVINAVLIKNMVSSNTSLKSAFWDNIGFLIRDLVEGDMLTYRQESGFSKKTHISLEKIPKNGYIKITTDPGCSLIANVVNGASFLMSIKKLSGDVKKYTDELFTEKLKEELLTAKVYASIIKDGSDLPKKLLKNISKEALVTSEAMGNFVETISKNLDEFDLGGVVSKTATSFGWSVGQKMLSEFTGPAGVALKAMFTIGKAENVVLQYHDYMHSLGVGSIYIHNQGGGIRASQQIKIESETDFSNETSLNVFQVEIDNAALDVLKEMSPEIHELLTKGITYTYNISLLENGEEVQPGNAVTVYIPIPDNLTVLAQLGMTRIYRMEEDGSMTELEVEIKDGCFVFTTDHFSLYSIVGYNPASSDSVKQGVCGEHLTWALYKDGVLCITGTGAMYDFVFESSPWYEYRNQITEIILPEGLTRIGNDAFRGLNKVQTVSIPDSVTEIGACAFIDSGLTNISLHEGLLVIGESAFQGTRLTSVDIPDSVATIGAWAFHQNSLESLYIPAGVTEIGRAAFSDNTKLQTITVDSENANFVADASGVLYSKDMATLYQCPGGFSGEYVIPEGVTTLESCAFDGCAGLTKVTIPDSVMHMPWQSTFGGCVGLTELILPDGITRLEYAFAFGDENLARVKLPEQLTTLGNVAFYGCTDLIRIVIPELVTEIGSGCFAESGLTSIVFCGNSPEINETAFENVTATAYYPGDDTTWASDVLLDYGGTITWTPYYGVANVTRIDAEKVVLDAGESINLTAILDPGESLTEDIIWTLSSEDDGTTLIGNGTEAILTAGWYIYDTVITVTAQTVIGDAEPAVLEITIRERPADYTLFSGKSVTLKEIDCETGKYYSSKRLTWSTYDEYAPYVTLTGTGRLTAKKVVSKARILVFSDIDGQPGFMRIVDILPAVTHVEVRNEEGTVVNGKTVTVDFSDKKTAFTATAYPLDTMQKVQWIISDAQTQAFAEYEINGNTMTVVNPKGKSGTVTVKAVVDAGQKKTITLKLQFGRHTQNVVITAATSEIYSGGSLQLSAATLPSAPTRAGITWSLSKEDKAYASISSSGLLKAKTVYDRTVVTVFATSKDGQAQAEYPVTILPSNESLLILRRGGKNVTMGTAYTDMNGDGTITLSAEYFDGSNPSVTWTVPKSVEVLAMTETSLNIRFLKAGTATIKATGTDGQKATVKVIAAQMAQSVEISQKKTDITEGLEVASGKSLDLLATVENAKNKKVTWSLAPGDEVYAKISSSGKFTANKDLTSMRQVTVIATAADGSGVYDDMLITIRPIAQGVQVYSEEGGQMLFSFRPQSWWVRSNTTIVWDLSTQESTIAMDTCVYPYYGEDDAKNAIQTVTWKSSAPKIANIVDGVLEIYKTGSVTITATAADGSGQKVSFKVKVVKTVTELKIDDQTIRGGKSLNLAKLVTINPADATNKKLIWTMISDDAYGTLSINGSFKAKKVTASKEAEVRVESQDGGARATFTVTIIP